MVKVGCSSLIGIVSAIFNLLNYLCFLAYALLNLYLEKVD